MSILANIAGYPTLTRPTAEGTAALAYDHARRRFLLTAVGRGESVPAAVTRNWGYYAPEKLPVFRPPFRSAALTVTGHCNMNCPYCFVYPVPHKAHLSPDMAVRAVRALEAHMTAPRCQLYLWGGEPTQNPPGLLAAADEIGRVFGDRCTATLTTNGYALDEIFETLAAYRFVDYQVSFDGTPDAQNRQKKIEGGSYERILHTVRLLSRLGRRPVLRLTVTAENAPRLGDIFTQIIRDGLTDRICVEPVHAYVGRSREQLRSQPDAAAYAASLMECAAYAESRGVSVYSQPLRPLTGPGAYDWGFINILPDGQAVSTVSVVDSSHPDAAVFHSGEVVGERLVLSDHIAVQQAAFTSAAAVRCVGCPVFGVCKGNEQRDYFVHGTPMATYRCEVFREIVRHWMDAALDGILPLAARTGRQAGAYRLSQRTGERARLFAQAEAEEDGAKVFVHSQPALTGAGTRQHENMASDAMPATSADAAAGNQTMQAENY